MSDHEQLNIANNNQETHESATPAIVSPPDENNGALTTGASASDQDVKGSSEQPKEEKVEDNKNRINLKVADGNGGEIWFKVKRSTPMKKIMQAYCEKQSKDIQSLRFLFDGQRIDPNQTADDMDMDDNDVIEAHHSQLGGGCF